MKKHGNAKRGLKIRAGAFGNKPRKNAAGFTLIEMMVVMAIIAIFTVLGVSALINLNSSNMADRVAEELATSIRDAQNKAISVSNSDDGKTPVAWGVYVDPSVGNENYKSFYVTYADSTATINYGSAASYSGVDLSVSGSSYYIYVTPFGKYYSSTTLTGTGWTVNGSRPNNLIPPSKSSSASTITITYRNSSRTVNIASNGDVYVQ